MEAWEKETLLSTTDGHLVGGVRARSSGEKLGMRNHRHAFFSAWNLAFFGQYWENRIDMGFRSLSINRQNNLREQEVQCWTESVWMV